MRNDDYLLSRSARQAHIKAAIEEAGGGLKVATALTINKSGPSQWIRRADVPREHCLALARMSGGMFRPECVRPLWPAEHAMADVLDAPGRD